MGKGRLFDGPVVLLRTLRPRQWTKNGLVFLPLLFAVNLVWSLEDLAPLTGLLLRSGVTAAAFCALSGAVYLLNDLMDRSADQNHPLKRLRPIAAGRVSASTAWSMISVLVPVGLLLMVLVSHLLAAVGLLYLAINLAYSLGAKRLALIDVMLVASGYVIRVAAGAIAIGVAPSPWLYTTLASAALFVVLGKRYAEVRLTGENPEAQRPVLGQYPGPFVGQLLTIAAAASLVSYTLYTVEAANLPANNSMLLTIPLVAYGLFRFLYLVHTSSEAEYPELLIIRDLPMLLSVAAWICASGLILLLNS